MEYYNIKWKFSHQKNKIMSFAVTWLDLETVILSEVSQRQICYHLYVDSLKKVVQANLFTKQIVTDAENKFMVIRG